MKRILLTFDLEEFDLIQNEESKFAITKNGLENLLTLLNKYNLSATFFTTANFAKRYPQFIRELSENYEIACHGYNHSDNYKKDISKIYLAKKEIEKIIGEKIHGFRAPRFEIKNISTLSDFYFEYDSSIHPTWIPGRYFNLFKNKKVHKIGNISEVPLSVLPIIRLSIFWLAFKNFPLIYSKIFTKINFISSDYTMLVFHPWEFADLRNIKISHYLKKKSGMDLIKMLERYILFCRKNNCSFLTVYDFLKSLK